MQVQFVTRENAPERMVAEAEVIFDEGPLAGLKLAGFGLWKSPEGAVYVTFPARAFGAGSERRYYDFLRPVDGNADAARRVKQWIRDAYQTGDAGR
jgi:hypothetical protein